MANAGEQILLMNTSGYVCYLEGEAVAPGEFITAVLDSEFDPLAAPQRRLAGPWGVSGWTMEELKRVAREIRTRRTDHVVWHKQRPTSGWQEYATRHVGRPNTVVGNVMVLPNLYSPQLNNTRDILIYLPPSYEASNARYPVIYMHDGQNLFDDHTSYVCEWRVDETLEAASQMGLEAIVVGIPNMGERRLDEYSPFIDKKHGGGKGADYLSFLVHTIKPRIDRDFRTRPEREHTGIIGSSMGGLISLYGYFRHCDIFGFAGILSPSLWFAERTIFNLVEYAHHVPGKLYLDAGTDEGITMLTDVRRMRDLLVRKGYRSPGNLHYVEAVDAGHCEAAWGQRLCSILQFLLADSGPSTALGAVPGLGAVPAVGRHA